MATITPTRFGLKYGPVPTLALEYEEDLGVVENDDGTRSLYVFKETAEPSGNGRRVRKKLHVVELPQLHTRSEPLALVRQLQKNNHKFLGPSVVKEQQLQRLLQQLVDHLPGNKSDADTRNDEREAEFVEPASRPAVAAATVGRDTGAGAGDEEEGDERLEESVMEDSAAEASVSMDALRDEADDVGNKNRDGHNVGSTPLHRTGKFVTQDDNDGEDDAEKDAHDASPPKSMTALPMTEEDRDEIEEDAKKKKALKSESDASEEEDVQSEELEYFSEDGSDEDSF